MSARYLNPFRLAAYVLVLFSLGHTAGALLAVPDFGPAAGAVADGMRSVTFRCESLECTWYGFYLGFGWLVTIFFLMSAGIAWFLGGLEEPQYRAVAPIGWMLFAAHAASAVLSWTYFFITPGVFSTVTAMLLGFACLKQRRTGSAAAV